NFEAGLTDGWTINGTAQPLAVSTTIFHGTGSHSLAISGRMTTATGPMYSLPNGSVKYSISVFALHVGSTMHDLSIQARYTCMGSAPALAAPITVKNILPGTWAQLNGTVTLPPANEPAGCKQTQASFFVQQEMGT